MMCLERLNNGVRCRHNKHLALITESAVPYLATDQNSGHYSPGPSELGKEQGGNRSPCLPQILAEIEAQPSPSKGFTLN